jgi:hypothetical protein
MAISAVNKVASRTATDATSYATASITPTANRWLILDFWVFNSDVTPVPPTTVTGNGLTWTLVHEETSSNGNHNLSRWKAWTGATPSAGAVTADFGAVLQRGAGWSISEFDGLDTSDPFVGTNHVVNMPGTSGTSIDCTLAAFAHADNRALIQVMHTANEASAPEAGLTELSDTNGTGPAAGHAVAWGNDTTPSYTWVTSQARAAIASELKAASTAQQVDLGFINQAGQVFSPTVTPQAVTVTVGFINQAGQVFAPTITQATVVTVGFINQAGQVFAPTITPGAVTVTLPFINQAGAVHAPTVVPQSFVTLPFINQAGQVFAPSVVTIQTVTIGFINQAGVVHAPVVARVTRALVRAGAVMYREVSSDVVCRTVAHAGADLRSKATAGATTL